MNLKFLFFLLIILPSKLVGQKFPSKKEWAFIPKGEVFKGSDELRKEYNRISKIDLNSSYYKRYNKYVEAFYISKFEVSNKNYAEFLNYLQSKKPQLYQKYKPTDFICNIYSDSTKASYGYNEIDNSYRNALGYPAIGITYEAATEYCVWLTSKLKNQLRKELEVRLPTEDEWIRAASGDNIYSQFPWKENELRNKKGRYLCNYKPIDEKNSVTSAKDNFSFKIVYSTSLDGYSFIAPIKSNHPTNQYGIYNLSGNVSEMILEKGKAKGGNWFSTANEIQISAINEYNEPACYVGFRPIIIMK